MLDTFTLPLASTSDIIAESCLMRSEENPRIELKFSLRMSRQPSGYVPTAVGEGVPNRQVQIPRRKPEGVLLLRASLIL
jgi:hypothetical protein